MVWLSWRKYKALVKDCWPGDFNDAAVNARNLDKLIIYSQAAPNKLPEISSYVEHRVVKYCERRGASHVAVGVTIACKLMRACSRDLPQLLGSLRSLTSFLLQHSRAECNVQGMSVLQEFAEHRHSSSSALLHTFSGSMCALMGKEVAGGDCSGVHACALGTAVLLLRELCDASSNITDSVCKQVLGDLTSAVLKHVKPTVQYTTATASPAAVSISAAAAAYFAEIGSQIRPGVSELLLPALFQCLRAPPCCGWHSDVAVDVVKHVCERVEERHVHMFVSAFADEVVDNLQKLAVTAVKTAVRVCLIVQQRVRDPALSLPFARLFSVTVDLALQPAWSITAVELQPITNKFASRIKSLARSFEMLHSILERTLKQVPARLSNETFAMVVRCLVPLALGGSRGQEQGIMVAAPLPAFSSPRNQADHAPHALRGKADKGQAARSGLKLLRALALCSSALCIAASVYMAASEHYDDALARIQSSYGMFIVFIVISIGITLSLASFVSNLLVGHSSRDDRVRLALKLKEYIVSHLAMASFLSGERAFGQPGDIFESSLWIMWFGFHIVPFSWLQVSRLRLQNLRRSANAGGGSPHERSCLLLLSMSAFASLGLCSFGWAATHSLGFSSMSVLAVLVHDGALMTCRALSIALSHTFYKRTQSSAHQVQPLHYVIIEQGLDAFIHCMSACIIVYMCGLRILSLGFLEILFFSQAASHASKAFTALRALGSAVSLEMSLNQVLRPVQNAPDDCCAVCFELLGGGSQDDSYAAAAAAATAAELGGCVRLPCDHCFHKHCMIAWLRKKAECPTCRASVWPVQTNGILFHFRPSPRAVAVAGGGGGGGGGAAAHGAEGPEAAAASAASRDRIDPSSALPVSAALVQPHSLLAVAPTFLPPLNPPHVPAAAPSFRARDANSHPAAALFASPSVDSQGEPEILYTDTRLQGAAAQGAADAIELAAAAPILADAAAVVVSGVSFDAPAAVAVAADAEQWTTVLRRRRRHIAQQ